MADGSFGPRPGGNEEWLAFVQPTGLVVAAKVLDEIGSRPLGQTAAATAQVADALETRDDRAKSAGPYIADPWAFVSVVLGWDARFVAGAPGGPPLPSSAEAPLAERGLVLCPDWVVTSKSGDPARESWQLFVRLLGPEVDLDRRGALEGWDATASQQMERLLREAGAPAGLIIGGVAREREHARPRPVLRLITAPKGETSGWMDFPVGGLAEVAGRSMLGGLKLLLGAAALYTAAPEHRLSFLIKASREAQANVSTDLAAQVLGALHALLRGFTAAAPHQIGELARNDPHHLYEGLLTVLMRLVFLLYAEDRDLLPAQRSGPGLELYEANYSVRGLLAKLEEDEARYPATMDDRVGGWGRLLALFRLVFHGDPHGWIQARGGKLFDPDAFPFLGSRHAPGGEGKVARVSDACVLQVLRGLMRLKGERLSYRTLAVEQIGSVYETVMGFTVETADGPSLAIKAGKRDRTPVFVNLETLAAVKPGERLKWLKDNTERGKFPPTIEAAIKAAVTPEDLAAAFETSARGGVVDERASPGKRIVPAGTPVLQPTDERRRTGSHYTPRSLTEPIVQHALEPAFERLGPDATAEQILDLKVCDPAMGSGAFLVEACRQLGARLKQAWGRWPQSTPIIPADEDDTLHARRLVAQKCLYGVDKNPMATDLAKLSLWLATLAKDHEFAFLDHALKSGDSLVGLTNKQIASLAWDDDAHATLDFAAAIVRGRLQKAETARKQIRFADYGVTVAELHRINRSAESAIADVRLIGDAIVGAFFCGDGNKARKAALENVSEALQAGSDHYQGILRALSAPLSGGNHPVRPFHWESEFPEVFDRDNPGFDAIVGNPPFLGGFRISGELGMKYFAWLVSRFYPAGHQCDLVGYFFRLAFANLRKGGAMGLVATDTIKQGDSRAGALIPIVAGGGCIYDAVPTMPWPGEATVRIATICVTNGDYSGQVSLSHKCVPHISAYLLPSTYNGIPYSLEESPYFSMGSKIYSQGFLFDASDDSANSPTLAEEIRLNSPDEAKRIRPYIGGDELTHGVPPGPRREVIFLSDLKEEGELDAYPSLKKIVQDRVKPGRMKLGSNPNNIPLKKRWWAYQAHRPELYERLTRRHRVLAISGIAAFTMFDFLSTDMIYSHKLCLVDVDSDAMFALLQSSVHDSWVRFQSSTMSTGICYTPSDCLETFPIVSDINSNSILDRIGRAYREHRAGIMERASEGLTDTYSRFHDPDETRPAILELRRLHAAMDRAVFTAYGWADLIPKAVPIFDPLFAEDEEEPQGARRAKKKWRYSWPEEVRNEVLARLLALNAERAKAERSAAGKASPTERAARRAKAAAGPAPGADGVSEHGPLFEREDG